MKQLAAQALAYQYKLQIDNAKAIINNANAGLEFIDKALKDTISATEKLKLLNCVGGGSSAYGFWSEFIDYDKKQVDKKRSRKDGMSIKEQFGVKSVATEIIDAKLAAEELYNISVLVDQRFGHGTWQAILTERNKRIEAAKEEQKERIN